MSLRNKIKAPLARFSGEGLVCVQKVVAVENKPLAASQGNATGNNIMEDVLGRLDAIIAFSSPP